MKRSCGTKIVQRQPSFARFSVLMKVSLKSALEILEGEYSDCSEFIEER